MAWDSSRPVPWRRLIREWLIYVGIASAAFVIFYVARGKKIDIALFVGLLSSGPMYLLFGGLMAKFGYQRKTLKELRTERPEPRSRTAPASATTGVRSKPVPTKR